MLRDAASVFFTREEERCLASLSFSPYRCREFVVGDGAPDVSGDADQQRDAFLAKVPEAAGRRIILFLSRIHPKKGVDLLLQAFARHADAFPEFDLVIARPDHVGLQDQLMTLAAELGIAHRVHWPGMLMGNEK